MSQKSVKAAPAKKIVTQFDLFNQLFLVVIAATVTTFPFIFDSFTVSKLFVLSVGLSYISIKLILNKNADAIRFLPKSLSVLVALFALAMIVSWSQSGVPILRGLFGQFGRGNGLFYYFFAILIFVYTVKTFKSSSTPKMHQLITILSWFMAVYAGLQRVGIDIAKLDTRGISPVVLTFGNSNFAGGMLSVLFAYHLTYSVVSKTYRIKQLALLFALIAGSTFAAAVQGYLIILFSIALAFSILITQRVRKPWITRLLISGWIIALVATILGVFGKFIFAGVFARASFQARIEYWRISLDVIGDYPIFGVGPDKLYDVTSNYMSPGSLKLITTTRMDNAHNWFLNLGANYGLVSMFFLLAILGVALRHSATLLKNLQKSNYVAVSSSIAFVCMFIDGLVSLEQPGIGIWLYVFAGIATASSVERTGYASESSTPKGLHIKIPFGVAKVATIAISFLLLISCAALSQRIYFDAILRSNVQTALLNKATAQTISSIERATIKLNSEPEYSTQALRPLAALGDAVRLDSISKAVYDYYPNSIQSSLIRADVLNALNRDNESCPIREVLIKNTPWDFRQLEKYIICSLDGFVYPEIMESLTKASKYFSEMNQSDIPTNPNEVKNLSLRVNQAAFEARAYFILGQLQSARDLQAYSNNLLGQLVELQTSDPTLVSESQINDFRKLLKF
jgi:O-antigen ligase